MEFTKEDYLKSKLTPDAFTVLYYLLYKDKTVIKYLSDISKCYPELEEKNYIKITTDDIVLRAKSISLKDNDILSEFKLFWDKYHTVTNLKKTDYQASLKYWKKLTNKERKKAIDNIERYYESLPVYNTGKPVKKARTYLADKNFNDEFESETNNTITFL